MHGARLGMALTWLAAVAPAAAVPEPLRIELQGGWTIESSAKVAAAGDALSRPGYDVRAWHRASVPTTVTGALVSDGTFSDPYVGTNLRQVPGTTYEIGKNFSNL